MSMIVTSRGRTRQPADALALNGADPAARLLVGLFAPWSRTDAVTGAPLSGWTGLNAIGPAIGGVAAIGAGSNYITGPNGYGRWAGKSVWGLILTFRLRSTSQTNTYVIRQGVGGGEQASLIYGYASQQFELFANGYSGTDPRTGSQITVADTQVHTLAYVADGTRTRGILDGRIVIDVAATTTFPGGGGEPSTHLMAVNGIGYCAIEIYALGFWAGAVPQLEDVREATRNPWRMFAPVRRPVFFSSSGTSSATLTSQGQAATSLKAGRNISVTFSSAGQASTTLLKGSIVGKTFSIAGQAATSLLGSYSIAGGNLLTINGQAATSFKAGRLVGKTLTSQGQAAVNFLKGAVVSATLTSQGQASTTILGGLGSASATFAILGRASTNFLVPSSTRGGGTTKKKNLRKKVKKRIEEDLFFIESSFKEVKKDKPVKERLQDIVQLQESLQPIIDRLKTLLPDDKIIQVEAKEELTEFKHIMKRFDSLEQRLQDIEDLTTIILSEI